MTSKTTMSSCSKLTLIQKFLNFSNVFLMIASTALIYFAVVLIKFYHLEMLTFWSMNFKLVPYSMIGLGLYTFLVAVIGFLISRTEQKWLMAFYTGLVVVALVLQMVSIFSVVDLKGTIIHVSEH